MPTKQELETINDELLTENSQLRREQSEQTEHLAALTESLAGITARLEALASNQQPSGSPDAVAAQIEPLVAGLKAMIEGARSQTREQDKRAQLLQTMLDRNEETSRAFLNTVGAAKAQTRQLGEYLEEWSGQPRLTLLKVAGAMCASTLLAGLLVASLVSWQLSPTRTLLEDATKWRVFTEEMSPEQVRQLEQGIENKLYQREQRGQTGAQTSGANAPPASAEPTPMNSSTPNPTINQRNRR